MFMIKNEHSPIPESVYMKSIDAEYDFDMYYSEDEHRDDYHIESFKLESNSNFKSKYVYAYVVEVPMHHHVLWFDDQQPYDPNELIKCYRAVFANKYPDAYVRREVIFRFVVNYEDGKDINVTQYECVFDSLYPVKEDKKVVDDKPPTKPIYVIMSKETDEDYSFFLDEADAESSLADFPIIDKNPNNYLVYRIEPSGYDVCNYKRVESIYRVRTDHSRYFFNVEPALEYYHAKLQHLKINETISLVRARVNNHATKRPAEFVTVASYNPNCHAKENSKMDETKIYVSSFVKDLNFQLAKILVLKAIIPDSERVDYELGAIEVTNDSPVIEFRFKLDTVEAETEVQFKERCFEKMRDLLIKRTKGKL